jgi:hypothetical protein
MPKHAPSTLRSDLLLVAAAGVFALAGPRVVRAHGALQWTRYHVAQAPDAAGQNAREAARWASTTLREAAPLPWGATAAELALDYGQRLESTGHSAAALALYERLRATLAELSESRWRRVGLAALRERAESRAQSAGARKDRPAPPAPSAVEPPTP